MTKQWRLDTGLLPPGSSPRNKTLKGNNLYRTVEFARDKQACITSTENGGIRTGDRRNDGSPCGSRWVTQTLCSVPAAMQQKWSLSLSLPRTVFGRRQSVPSQSPKGRKWTRISPLLDCWICFFGHGSNTDPKGTKMSGSPFVLGHFGASSLQPKHFLCCTLNVPKDKQGGRHTHVYTRTCARVSPTFFGRLRG